MNVYEGKPEFDKIHTSKLITIQILFSHIFTIQKWKTAKKVHTKNEHDSATNLRRFWSTYANRAENIQLSLEWLFWENS